MARPKTIGFSRNVKTSTIHNEGQKLREAHERMMSRLTENNKTMIAEGMIGELKPAIVKIVERAFRRYCKRHNAPADLEELEWQRFKKILQGML